MRKLTGLLIATSLLTGCTTMNLPSTGPTNYKKQTSAQRQQALANLTAWDIDGAFSLTSKNKTNIASYTWKQTQQRFTISIQSSLNIYSLILAGYPGHVQLKESKQKTSTASTPEALMQQRLGWSLPVSNLRYWIRGIAAKGASQRKFDQYGHLTSLRQQGWSVQLSNYANVSQYDLPRTLNITGHGIKLRIVVKHWALR